MTDPGPDRFPVTRPSLVEQLAAPDPVARERALVRWAEAYAHPLYKYLRLHHRRSVEEAEELSQAFFTHVLDSTILADFDPARAKFRTWLRLCLDRFLASRAEWEGRKKRGGDRVIESLDVPAAEAELAQCKSPTQDSPEAIFEREWVRELFSRAVESLERECRQGDAIVDFEIFRKYDLEGQESSPRATYESVAAELDISVSRVTNTLHRMRSRLRSEIEARLAETCGSPEEARAEAREWFGGRGT